MGWRAGAATAHMNPPCVRELSKIQTVHWIYLWMISNGGYKRHMSHESYTSVDALICQGLD